MIPQLFGVSPRMGRGTPTRRNLALPLLPKRYLSPDLFYWFMGDKFRCNLLLLSIAFVLGHVIKLWWRVIPAFLLHFSRCSIRPSLYNKRCLIFLTAMCPEISSWNNSTPVAARVISLWTCAITARVVPPKRGIVHPVDLPREMLDLKLYTRMNGRAIACLCRILDGGISGIKQ